MNYQNPKIPEGINVSDEHPLKDFVSMLVAVGIIVALLIGLLAFIAEQFVQFIPFEVELALAEQFQQDELTQTIEASESAPNQKIEVYLQQLADQLAKSQQLPEPMLIRVHYVDSKEINAFATLGGNIFIFRGLLEKMPDENALSMVMAHEIAHIHNRDPIVAMSRGLTIGVAVMSLMGVGDGAISQQLVGQIGLLSNLSFSRKHEQRADALALQTLQAHYGHIQSADVIFKLFIEEQGSLQPPAFLSTHPHNQDRLEDITQHPAYSQQGKSQSLPPWLYEELALSGANKNSGQ